MENIKPYRNSPNYFQTTDVVLAAYLKFHGFGVREITIDENRELPNNMPLYVFVFDVVFRDSYLQEVLAQWRTSNSWREIKKFVTIYRDLRKELDQLKFS